MHYMHAYIYRLYYNYIHTNIILLHNVLSCSFCAFRRFLLLCLEVGRLSIQVRVLLLTDYVEKAGILYRMQYGFRQNYSVDMALVNIQDLITKAIDSNQYAAGVFLDFAKAFDTVDHSILCKNMSIYEIRGVALLWFTDYLLGRTQQANALELFLRLDISSVESLCRVPILDHCFFFST